MLAKAIKRSPLWYYAKAQVKIASSNSGSDAEIDRLRPPPLKYRSSCDKANMIDTRAEKSIQAGMMTAQSIPTILAQHCDQCPDAPAILGLEGSPLTYRGLYEQVQQTVEALRALGIGRNQRVGLIVPQGPELATVSLGVMSGATAVPLDPTLTADEYRTYLPLLKVQALIIQSGIQPEARTIAAERHIPVIDLVVDRRGTVGCFTLSGEQTGRRVSPQLAQPEDTAVVLISSGTTSRPKVILKDHATLIHISLVRKDVHGSNAQERLFNVIAFWFSRGQYELIRMVVTGASVLCTAGFDASRFFEMLERFQPTLFSGTSDMYRAILPHAAANQDIFRRHPLHYLRATSMATPADLIDELEAVFGIPVIQLYGTTETSTITTNPLPPGVRKRNSVGTVIEGDVAICDDGGKPLSTGQVGEIWVRGPHVFKGYEDNAAVNAAVMEDGWYKTGDQGYFDQDGYLFLTGRVKELINRGGVKISPQEVESVLIDCPGVAEAAAFAVPDRHVGEEVGAAIVRQPGSTVTESDIRLFAAARLATAKIPRYIVFLEALPRTSMGKVKRLDLAENVKTPLPKATIVAPRTEVEQQLAALWAELLGLPAESIGVNSHFKDLGGHSIAAAHLIFRARATFSLPVTILDFFDAPTVAEQARVIEKLSRNPSRGVDGNYLLPLQPKGTRPALYCSHALEGGVSFYRDMAAYLGPDQPIYGVQAVGVDDGKEPLRTVNAMAAHNFQQIKAVQLRGPYYLCGYSFGGRVALETGRLLRDAGDLDTYVLIIDDQLQTNALFYRPPGQGGQSLRSKLDSLRFGLQELPSLYRRLYFRQRVSHYWQHLTRPRRDAPRKVSKLPIPVMRVQAAAQEAARQYIPRPYDGHVRYVFGLGNEVNIPLFKSLKLIGVGDFSIHSVPGTHTELFTAPYIAAVGHEIRAWLDERQRDAQPH